MSTNKQAYMGNVLGAPGPYCVPGKFQAGSSATVKRGALLEKTAGGSTQWIEMDSDYAMSADVAISAEEIKSSDRAGYYRIAVPRPGDLWRFALSAAGNPALGSNLYWSDSQTLATSGTNVASTVAGHDHYPDYQGHLTDEPSGDAGTTIRSVSNVTVSILAAASYWADLFA